MILQYQLTLSKRMDYADAYRLYAWLLGQVSFEDAQMLHNLPQPALSQYIRGDTWTVNLLSEEAVACLAPCLETAALLSMDAGSATVAQRARTAISAQELLQKGRELSRKRTQLSFVTPAAFKQNGRYTIFPQEGLLVQSLIGKWNILFPEYPLQDEDFVLQLQQGIHIVDYKLRTGRFPLKGVRIPCFYGELFLEHRLPVVVQELWHSLLYLATFTGVGIKTTLGMGGVQLPK